MISHNIRERLDKDYVRERYSQALKQYKENLEKGNYVVSFLLISALLEERINVSWLLLDWYGTDTKLNLVNKPTQSELIGIGIKKKINLLRDNDWIDKKTFEELKSLTRERNFLIHLSLYNMKEYTREINERFYAMFREIDKVSREIKQMIDESK